MLNTISVLFAVEIFIIKHKYSINGYNIVHINIKVTTPAKYKIIIFVTLNNVLYFGPNILNIVYGRSNSSFLLWITKSVQVLQDIMQNIRAIIKELNIPD